MGWYHSAAPPHFPFAAQGYLPRGQGAIPLRVPLRRKIGPKRLQARLGAGAPPGTEWAPASLLGPRPWHRQPHVGRVMSAAPPDLPAASRLDVLRREWSVHRRVPFGCNVRMSLAERILRCHGVARADRARGSETGSVLNPGLPFVSQVIPASPPYHLGAPWSDGVRRKCPVLGWVPFQGDIGMGFRERGLHSWICATHPG
jgi:hypothetical protein